MSDQEHPRKCDNWIADFLQWTLPRGEAKESYVFWTALFTLACVLRRHVKVSEEYLGSWECYPYLYLLFLGPPGNKKTTTVNYNVQLLNEVTGITPAPDQLTVPKFASALAEAEECAMYVNAGELSEFISKSGTDMFSFLTRAFDGAKKLSVGTHMRGIELAENPCVNFLGASTLETLSEILPQSSLDGGFGRRCIFIHEEDVRQRRLIYKDVVDVKKLNELYFSPLVEDLRFIGSNLFGEFKMDEKTYRKFDDWYIEGAGSNKLNGKKMHRKMKGYYETKPAFVMKVAMMLRIADRDVINKDQLYLTWDLIEEAIGIVESTEANMTLVLANTGKNIYKADIKSMYTFIKDNSPIFMHDIISEFMAVAEPNKLIELIKGMSDAGMITLEPEGSLVKVKVK